MRVVLFSLVVRDSSEACLLLFYLRDWLLNMEMWDLTLVLLLLFLGWILLFFSIFIVVIVLVLVFSLLGLSFGAWLLGLDIAFHFLFFLGCLFALLLALLFLLLFCLFLKEGQQRIRRPVPQFLWTLVAICSLVGPSQPRLPCFPYLPIFL